MQSIKQFVVRVDRSKEETIEVGGAKLFLDTRFNEYQHITQEGVVECLPADPKFHVKDVNVGDKIYFHHFICMDENDVSTHFNSEKTHYLCEKFNVYAVEKSDGIYAVQDYVLVDYIEEDESKIKTESGIYLKTTTDREFRKGVVRYAVNPDYIGRKVFFARNHDYEMTIGGKRMYRMTEKSLLACVTEEEYFPTYGNYLVEALESDERKLKYGTLELIASEVNATDDGRKSKFRRGRIIRSGEGTSVEVGSEIMYRYMLDKKDEVKEGDKKYFILGEENVECVLEYSE